ncbi:MAG: hypothetical protein IJB96_10745 [Lachnospira sp.]|nr:hypothetical protein [Lachnospira sp.]
MDNISLLKRRLTDTAKRAYSQGNYTYSSFLSMSEIAIYKTMSKELEFIKSDTFGGYPNAERQVIQFGDSTEFGYVGTYPIDVIKVEPLSAKFSQNLTHRDYLGAILNLGIERHLIGDIIIRENEAYVFCLKRISEFIIDNLDTIKHTHVKCSLSWAPLEILRPNFEELDVIAASPRIDAVVSALTNKSRSAVVELFKTGKIFVNSFSCQDHSKQLKEGDILVIRHVGKFIYDGSGNETRSGRVYVHMRKYV